MDCTSEGSCVRDVLLAAGVKDDEPLRGQVKRKHVQSASGGKVQRDGYYGGSIPFESAIDLDMDMILALKVCLLPVRARFASGCTSFCPVANHRLESPR